MAFSTMHDLHGIQQPYADNSLRQMKETGVNYAHVTAYGRMLNKDSLSWRLYTNGHKTRYLIRKMHKNGLRVFFKPVIEIDDGTWRGMIKGTDEWFHKVYSPFIMKMAKIAQSEHVEIMAVGSEYRGTLWNTYAWRQVIKRVRTVYKGRLTYVGNHDVSPAPSCLKSVLRVLYCEPASKLTL